MILSWPILIFNSSQTLSKITLCNDRGYIVSQNELIQTLEQSKAQFGDKQSENLSKEKLQSLVANQIDKTNQIIRCSYFSKKIPKYGSKLLKLIALAWSLKMFSEPFLLLKLA